jgi:hypothetical protein
MNSLYITVYRHENSKANVLAQLASGHNVSNKNFSIAKKLACVHVQNMFLSVMGGDTGLTEHVQNLFLSVMGADTGLTKHFMGSAPGPTEHQK